MHALLGHLRPVGGARRERGAEGGGAECQCRDGDGVRDDACRHDDGFFDHGDGDDMCGGAGGYVHG